MVAFTLSFDFVYPEEVSFTTHIVEKEDGTEKRQPRMLNGLHVFELQRFAQSDSDRQDLLDFFEARKARNETFTFTNPVDSVVFTVRFQEDELEFIKRIDTRWDARWKFREVL